MADKRKEADEFFRAASQDYHAYAWEMDGHPAMRRVSIRRIRHSWHQSRREWVMALTFLAILVIVGVVVWLVAG